jgi:hypothetical protein
VSGTEVPRREPRCDHTCLLDDGHVERGEGHQYGYELPSPRGLREAAQALIDDVVDDCPVNDCGDCYFCGAARGHFDNCKWAALRAALAADSTLLPTADEAASILERCPASISGNCLDLTEGFGPCSGECNRDPGDGEAVVSTPKGDVLWEGPVEDLDDAREVDRLVNDAATVRVVLVDPSQRRVRVVTTPDPA